MGISIIHGDCLDILKGLPAECVDCCVTSPPYWGLRNYNVAGQMGLEKTPEEFIDNMVVVFREVRRILRDKGTLWLNIGDSYARNGGAPGGGNRALMYYEGTQKRMLRIPQGSVLKQKDLVGIPWMLAFALRADGWYLRQDIIWQKPNPMPESVTDRCTKSHEYIFLLAKSPNYYYDQEATFEPISINTHARVSQDVINQSGSNRVPGKTNGPMKACARLRKEAPPGEGIKSNESFNAAMIHPGRKSGNKERKTGAQRGCPEGSGSNVCGSVPWEGYERNKRSVWTVPTKPFKEAHFATYPPELIEPCILAGCPKGGIILDPFFGAGTTGLVADRLGRDCLGIELNRDYIHIAENRLKRDAGMFSKLEIKERA